MQYPVPASLVRAAAAALVASVDDAPAVTVVVDAIE